MRQIGGIGGSGSNGACAGRAMPVRVADEEAGADHRRLFAHAGGAGARHGAQKFPALMEALAANNTALARAELDDWMSCADTC